MGSSHVPLCLYARSIKKTLIFSKYISNLSPNTRTYSDEETLNLQLKSYTFMGDRSLANKRDYSRYEANVSQDLSTSQELSTNISFISRVV